MRRRLVVAALGLALAIPSLRITQAAEVKDFTPLFNGKDLSGWHGMPTFDPRKLAEMKEEDRAKQVAEWTADAKKHWSVDEKEECLVNDGQGA